MDPHKEGGDSPEQPLFLRHPRSAESLQSSLSADSEEVRVLGAPISDRSDSDEEGQKPKLLVDNEGRNVQLEAEEEDELKQKEEDSLRDFEEQEREVARQLAMEGTNIEEEGQEEQDDGTQLMEQIREEDEDEQEQEEEEKQGDEEMDEMEGPSTKLWQMEAEELPRSSQSRVSESLQNRQFTGAELLRDEPALKHRLGSADSAHSTLGGFPLDYPADPPPAYTSPRTISRGRLFVGERPNTSSALAKMNVPPRNEEEPKESQEGEHPTIEGYAVPSPRFGPKEEPEDSADEDKSETGANIRAAIGSSFALAGGMAAAVAATAQLGQVQQAQPIATQPANINSPRVLIQGARTAADLANKAPESARNSARSSAEKERQKAESSQQRFPVNAELRSLFRHIEDFVAEKVEIEPLLRPFQIDYIPAVGDVDPFIKVPRPDEMNPLTGADWLFGSFAAPIPTQSPNEELQLGLVVLDEPAASQSDPAIVDLRLHQMAGKSGSADVPVKKLSRADRNAHQIDRWVQSVRDLRRTKPPDRVHYSKPMPSIEHLMQEWPQDVEQKLKGMKLLLNSNLDAALEDYVDICLAMVDVPVHKSRLEALHLFFSLYAEFRNSQHFRNLALGQDGERGETAPTTVDNFVLDDGLASTGQERANRLEIDT